MACLPAGLVTLTLTAIQAKLTMKGIVMIMEITPRNQVQQKSLSELVAALGEARQASSNAYEAYKEQKAIEDQLRYELELTLKAEGLRSAKGQDFTASIVEKPKVIITNEARAIDWIKHNPDVEADLYIGLKETLFKSLAEGMLKNTGELIPGTEVGLRESLAIRSNKQEKKVQG